MGRKARAIRRVEQEARVALATMTFAVGAPFWEIDLGGIDLADDVAEAPQAAVLAAAERAWAVGGADGAPLYCVLVLDEDTMARLRLEPPILRRVS